MIETAICNFVEKNKGSLLLIGGFVGFVATNILTAKAAIKYKEKKDELIFNLRDERTDLTLKEEMAIAVPTFAPAVVTGVVSAGLIFGGNRTYAQTQAGLVSAYTLLNTKYSKYRDAALKSLGVDSVKEIETALKQPQIQIAKKVPVSSGSILVFDSYHDRYLETTMEELQDAEYQLNRILILHNRVSLNDWYELLGFEPTIAGEELGWSAEYLYDTCDGYCWIDFEHELVLNDNDQYYILKFEVEPIAGYKER